MPSEVAFALGHLDQVPKNIRLAGCSSPGIDSSSVLVLESNRIFGGR